MSTSTRKKARTKIILAFQKQSLFTQDKLGIVFPELGAFFARQGFSLLYAGKRSYFRHILGHDVPLYVYGKKL